MLLWEYMDIFLNHIMESYEHAKRLQYISFDVGSMLQRFELGDDNFNWN